MIHYLVKEEVVRRYGFVTLGIGQGKRLISGTSKRRDDDEDSNGRIYYVFRDLS